MGNSLMFKINRNVKEFLENLSSESIKYDMSRIIEEINQLKKLLLEEEKIESSINELKKVKILFFQIGKPEINKLEERKAEIEKQMKKRTTNINMILYDTIESYIRADEKLKELFRLQRIKVDKNTDKIAKLKEEIKINFSSYMESDLYKLYKQMNENGELKKKWSRKLYSKRNKKYERDRIYSKTKFYRRIDKRNIQYKFSNREVYKYI